jgi:hypothetical protein
MAPLLQKCHETEGRPDQGFNRQTRRLYHEPMFGLMTMDSEWVADDFQSH